MKQSTIPFEDLLTKIYGKIGTLKRKKADMKLKKIEAELVKIAKLKMCSVHMIKSKCI